MPNDLLVDLQLLRPVWPPDGGDAFDMPRDNHRALFETLDEVYETLDVRRALMLVDTQADAHVLCQFLESRHHAYGYVVPNDVYCNDILLNGFEAGATRVLVAQVSDWWQESDFTSRHVLYECDLVVYAGGCKDAAMDVRGWVEGVIERYPDRVRKPIRFLEIGPALFGWNVQWHSDRRVLEELN